MERRHHPRLYEPFPATVRGMDARGEAFEEDTVLDNLSAGGLYVRLQQPLKQEEKVSAIVRLARTQTSEALGPRVAIEGVVVRTDEAPSGMHGVAVRFTRHRFL